MSIAEQSVSLVWGAAFPDHPIPFLSLLTPLFSQWPQAVPGGLRFDGPPGAATLTSGLALCLLPCRPHLPGHTPHRLGFTDPCRDYILELHFSREGLTAGRLAA